MATRDDIKNAERALAEGYLFDAREFFSHLLSTTTDPTLERIAENRILQIDKQIRMARKTASFDIETDKEEEFLICNLRIRYRTEDIKGVIGDIYHNSHRENYPSTSSVEVYQRGAQQVEVELSGYGKDERCEWCKLFRKNVVYYIGKKNLVRHGYCPLGITEK